MTVALLFVAAACSAGEPGVTASRSVGIPTPIPDAPATEPDVDSDPGAERQSSVEPNTSTAPAEDAPEPDSDAPLTQDEIDEIVIELVEGGFCDPDDVRGDGVVTAMHFVVQAQLQPPCYVDQPNDGDDVADVVVDDDPRLLAAWESLTAITPDELVADISLLAGFEPCSICDTLAFVTTLDEDATFFLMAVDVVSGGEDPDELRLTMMHELTHVFAQKPGEQLDVTWRSAAGCATFFNGNGCFESDSYIWAWIQEFWPPEILDTLPEDGSVGTAAEAEFRCSTDPAYTGSYAAVHPEEDFAETFSAYVYDVEVDPALSEKFAFFDRYPEFVSIRDNARELGIDATEANFDGCG